MIERLISELDEYFFEIVQIILKIPNDRWRSMPYSRQSRLFEKQLRRIKECFDQKKRIVRPTLNLFDKELQNNVWSIMQENHDQVLIELERAFWENGDDAAALELLISAKAEIYKYLYEFDLKRLMESGKHSKHEV